MKLSIGVTLALAAGAAAEFKALETDDYDVNYKSRPYGSISAPGLTNPKDIKVVGDDPSAPVG